MFGKGYEVEEVKNRCYEMLPAGFLVVLYEVDLSLFRTYFDVVSESSQ